MREWMFELEGLTQTRMTSTLVLSYSTIYCSSEHQNWTITSHFLYHALLNKSLKQILSIQLSNVSSRETKMVTAREGVAFSCHFSDVISIISSYRKLARTNLISIVRLIQNRSLKGGYYKQSMKFYMRA